MIVAGSLLVLASIALTPAPARAASSNVAVSADPTQGKPVTVTVSGDTEEARYLWVVAFPEATQRCESANASELTGGYPAGERLINFQWIAAGSYEKTTTFTPPEPDQYRICAFLADGLWDTAEAKAGKAFTVRAAKATSKIEVSPDPVARAPVTVTISGQVEIDRYLWVAVLYGGTQACESYRPTDGVSGGWGGEHLMKMKSIAAGSYRQTVTVSPPDVGSFRICSFVTGESFDKVSAKGSGTFHARQGRAQISVSPEGTFRHLSKSSYSVEGVTEVAGALRSLIFFGRSDCPSKPRWDVGMESERVEAGKFGQEGWRFVPRFAGAGRICTYLTDGRGQIVGVASADVFVKRNPAFAPKLITPNGKVGFGRVPVLKWKFGPDIRHLDYFQIHRVRPKGPKPTVHGPKPTRGIRLDGRTTRFGGRKASGVSKVWVLKRLPPGRYWWRIIRQDPESKYWEASRLGMIVVAPRR